jgi:hypothetical protein
VRPAGDHPETRESSRELPVFHVCQARGEDTEPLLREACHGRESKLGPEHPHTSELLNQLVNLYEA